MAKKSTFKKLIPKDLIPKGKEPKINMYRNISWSFVVFTAMLLVAVFLLFNNKATVIVSANDQDVNLSFKATVKANPTESEIAEMDVVKGAFVDHEKTGEGEFEVLSTKTVDSQENVGQVKIINNSDRDQTLVKTTQLEAPNGVIVRTSDRVVVKAGETAMVGVYPKESTTFVDVAPGNLTIIKLNPAMQPKIFGVNEQKLTSAPREIKVLAESDIKRAEKQLADQLIADLKKELGLGSQAIFAASVVKSEADQKIGAEVAKFKLKITVKIKELQIDNGQMVNLINRKVKDLNIPGLSTDTFYPENLSYNVADADYGGSVLLKVNYILKTKLTKDNEILNRANFAGRTPAEVKQYLDQFEYITNADVFVSPYWKKTLPNDIRKINVVIK